MSNFMKTTAIAIIAVIGISTASAAAQPLSQEIGAAPEAAENYQLTDIATGLDTPWSLAFLPDGSMLVTEKPGRLRVIRDDTLLAKAVGGVPTVFAKGQAGLFDVVLHPEFSENGMIYLSYAHQENRKNTLRLARARFEPDTAGGSLADFEVLFTGQSWRTTSAHYGGRIVFLPDGTLLMSTGEGYRFREQAQKLDNHFGKIVRLNDDGTVPDDNPFVGQADALPEIWSYGHRNPQGLIFDAENGIVYAHEHGPRGGDEVNIIEKGTNYGWPVICYCIDYTGAAITPYTRLEGMAQSIVHYVPSIAPSGLTIYTGDKFPDWQGDLFIGALAHQHVRRIDLENGVFGAQEKLFTSLDKRIRDVRTGPDGYLYFLTDKAGGKVIQVSPK